MLEWKDIKQNGTEEKFTENNGIKQLAPKNLQIPELEMKGESWKHDKMEKKENINGITKSNNIKLGI